MAQSRPNGSAAGLISLAPDTRAPDRRLGGIFAVLGLLALLFWVPAADAREDSHGDTPGNGGVFTVSGVAVDATADTAAAARDQALAEGQKAALGRLFARMVLAVDRPKLPPINAGAVAELVRDFEVTREKTSSVRYLAVLRVRFKPDGVRDLLRAHDIGFAETRSRPVLVLPVFEVAGAYSLWGPNPWREAWQAAPPSDGLVPLVRPANDIRNAVLIGAEQAVRGADDRLAAIARHYRAASVLVAVAGFRMGSAGEEGQPAQPFLQVTLSRMGTAFREQTRLESFALRAGESREAATSRAVAAIADQIQEEWKRDNRLRFGVGNDLIVTVPLASLADWLTIQRRLAGVAFIRRSGLLFLSRKQARLRISYIGDEDQLTLALVENELILERGPTTWTLRHASSGRGGAQPNQVPGQAPGQVPGEVVTGGSVPGGTEPKAPIPQAGRAP